MMRWQFKRVVALFVGAVAALPVAAAEGPRIPPEVMQPIGLQNGRLAGPGGEALVDAVRSARVLLIGEEHGLAEPARIATALVRALPADGPPPVLVAEVGPFAAAEVERLVRNGDRAAWNRLYSQAPYSIPFFWFTEEIALAEAVAAANGSSPAIWGVDQEFVLSGALHLSRLAEGATDEEATALTEQLLAAERDAFVQMTRTKDPSSLGLLLQDDDRALRRLRGLLDDPDARERIDALLESRRIYRLHDAGKGAQSNLERAALMKRQLDAMLRRAGGLEEVRVVAKLGAFHVARGVSPLGVRDVGDHLASLAGERESFHLLVLPVGGVRNARLPFTGPDADRLPVECPSLGPLASLCVAVGEPEGWRYVDLRPLREAPDDTRETDDLDALIRSYDALVVIPEATPATMLPANRDAVATAGGP